LRIPKQRAVCLKARDPVWGIARRWSWTWSIKKKMTTVKDKAPERPFNRFRGDLANHVGSFIYLRRFPQVFNLSARTNNGLTVTD